MAKEPRKKASKKGLILQKAATLFRQRGFAASSMRDLAETVGIEAASLYNHIRSKNEILEAICFEVANSFNLHMDKVEAANSSSIQKLEQVLRFHVHQMVDNFEQVYVSDREWKHLEEPYLSNFHTQRRNYRKRFAALIEEGITKKEIRPIDSSTAVLLMLHAIGGVESWHRSKRKISAKELEENILTILIGGLRKND
ncbi:MAG: TetR/AcrR family transcriptional regulator [Chitinophagaceae bacterium]|jgi:AcrR family transcriptional regulator